MEEQASLANRNGLQDPEPQTTTGDTLVEAADSDLLEDSPGQASPVRSDVDEEYNLDLLATAKDQDELERDIGRQADVLLIEQADERDKARLEKTEQQKQRHLNQLRDYDRKLAGPGGSVVKNKIRADKARAEALIKTLEIEIQQIKSRIADRHQDGALEARADEAGNRRLPNETHRQFLIRTGKITPFSKIGTTKTSANLADVMLDAEQAADGEDEDGEDLHTAAPISHVNLKKPGFLDFSETSSAAETSRSRIVTGRRRHAATAGRATPSESTFSATKMSDDDFLPGMTNRQLAALGETEDDLEDRGEEDEDYALITPGRKKRKPRRSESLAKAKKLKASDGSEDEEAYFAGVDDGNEKVYQARVESWSKRRRAARLHAQRRQADANVTADDEFDFENPSALRTEDADSAEWYQPHPTNADHELHGGFRIPGDIFPALFDYQKTGVRWLWELYEQKVGGIVGDEMGLGKTIQIISFLAGLHHSRKLRGPVIIVAPATVMKQWVNEFHRWWPPLRVSILHTSGSGMLNVRREREIEEELEFEAWNEDQPRRSSGPNKAAKRIVDRVAKDGHILVTTYSGLQTYADILLHMQWQYAVLDEGHKIRNPDTAITMYCKMLRTHNRVILSGTPIQNNLTELWSLLDFVYPMRLGSLVTFRNQFEFPIKQGGYANASNLQVETAARCAEALKETISPYLLQRFKVDVAQDLPKKTERIMFCKLTVLQREAYTSFLNGEEMASITSGKRQALYGIDLLRKICNHPDLASHKLLAKKTGYDYGNPAKSGKMQVVKELLQIWKKRGHKALLFAQHRIMLDIMEKMVRRMDGFRYLRMDGNTSIQERQNLVDDFNKNADIHVFLLTTKVGGLGVNLTGADRVIIYDPDWNPSTDSQARERAWRLGQKREVEIYRLMTAGTIEEKIYHRQVFKQFLTNKILRDPKSRQTFQLKDLHDLFTLGDASDETETGTLFKNTKVDLNAAKRKAQATEQVTESVADAEAQAELNAIRGLHHQEDFNPADEEQAADAEDKDKPDRLLSSIFDRAGVHSMYEHDAIINPATGKRKVTADPEVISREARRIADQAARQLRRAGELARSVPAGQTTWTGVHGTTGRPAERPRPSAARGGHSYGGRGGRGGGASSSLILSGLTARQGLANGTNAEASSSRDSTPQRAQPRGVDFMKMIVGYLKAHGGAAYTQMLIDHFNHYCRTEQRTAEFKEMLRTVADLDKGARGTGRGRWVLKDEWKDH